MEVSAEIEEKLGYQKRRWKKQRRVRDPKLIRQRKRYLQKNRAKLKMKARKKYKEYKRNPNFKRQRKIQQKERQKRHRMATLSIKVAMEYIKQSAQDTHVSFKDLPDAVKAVLKKEGMRPQDIRVRSSTTFSPSEASSFGDGYRGLGFVIDLGTGQYTSWESGWGVPIRDQPKQNIPVNGVVIIGQEGGTGGGRRVSYMLVNPQNMGLILQNKDIDLSDQEGAALALIKEMNSGGRKKDFPEYGLGQYGPQNQYILSLRDKGLVVIKGTGVSITTTGKNLAKKSYEFDRR